MAYDQIALGTDDFQAWGDKSNEAIKGTWTEQFGAGNTNLHIAMYGQSYLVGQSEDGYGAYTTECTTPQTYADETILTNSTDIGDAISQKVQARGPSVWGPEIFGAINLQSIAGWGSTWSSYGWNGANTDLLIKGGLQYTAFLATIAKSKTDYGVGDPDILIYAQNAGNASDSFLLTAYEDYREMFDNLISDLGTIPIIVMSPNDYPASAENFDKLRIIMEQVCGLYDNIYMVQTDGCEVGTDGSSHFTAEGYKQFGERVADRILAQYGGARKFSTVWERDPQFQTMEAKKVITGEASISSLNAEQANSELQVSKAMANRDSGPLMFNGSPLADSEYVYGRVEPEVLGLPTTNFKLWDQLIGSGAGYHSASGTEVTWKGFYEGFTVAQVGEYAVVHGCNPASYNGVWEITAVDATSGTDTITVACTVTDAYVSGAKLSMLQPLVSISDSTVTTNPSCNLNMQVKAINTSLDLSDYNPRLSLAYKDTYVVYEDLTLAGAKLAMASVLHDSVGYAGVYYYSTGKGDVSITTFLTSYDWLGYGVSLTAYTNEILGS